MRLWNHTAAAVIGRGHIKAGTPCQDVAVTETLGSVTAAVVADGAGSASRSDIGAAVAADVVLDLLEQRFEWLAGAEETAIGEEIVSRIRDRFGAVASNLGIETKELACTLLFVAIDGEGYLSGHLGDGFIACQRGDTAIPFSIHERGEFANETVFVTSRGADTRLRVRKGSTEGIAGFALMTDGAAESLYSRHDGKIARAVAKMIGWLESSERDEAQDLLESSLKGPIRGHTSDDCSIALLCRPSTGTDLESDAAPTVPLLSRCA